MTVAAIRSNLLIVSALAFSGAVMGGYIELPPWAGDALIGACIAAVIGWIGGSKLASLMSEPPDFEEVVETDSERDVAQTWIVPPEAWENRRNESDADAGAYYREGSGNWGVRELDYDEEEGVAVVQQAPARRKIDEMTDDALETWVDAVWRQRGHYRDKVFEAAEITKSLPELRDEIALEYYSSETREIEEQAEHDEDVLFGPVDKRVEEIREDARSDDVTDEERAVREIMRDLDGVDQSDFDRLSGDEGGDNDE